MENLLNLEPTETYLKGINKLPNKQQELIKKIANILSIGINLLLNYSWINHILLKQKLFMT